MSAHVVKAAILSAETGETIVESKPVVLMTGESLTYTWAPDLHDPKLTAPPLLRIGRWLAIYPGEGFRLYINGRKVGR